MIIKMSQYDSFCYPEIKNELINEECPECGVKKVVKLGNKEFWCKECDEVWEDIE